MPEQPEDFEDAWARIVEDLTTGQDALSDPSSAEPRADGGAGPSAGPSAGGAPADGGGSANSQAGLQALFEPLRRAREDPSPALGDGTEDPGAFVDNWQDEGHYTPPPPPELPEGTPVTRLAWAGLIGGPVTMALIALTTWDPPSIVGIGAGVATLAGFITLVWQLPDSREDSGWDDGARL